MKTRDDSSQTCRSKTNNKGGVGLLHPKNRKRRLCTKNPKRDTNIYLADEENLVTALVPSEMACLESSPGRMSRTAVWISRDEMVDRWLYEASLEASEAIRSKMSETNELRMAMALFLDEVSAS